MIDRERVEASERPSGEVSARAAATSKEVVQDIARPLRRLRGAATYVRWRWLLAGMVSALTVGIAMGWEIMGTDDWINGVPWERALMLQVHSHPLPRWADMVMLVAPWIGTNWTLAPITIVGVIWLLRRHRFRLASHLMTVLVGSSVLNFALKFLFDRPRPNLWELRGQFQYSSYPSGHAIASVAVLLTLTVMLHRYRGWTWPYLASALILGLSLYSRVYLGVHWPTDVIAGYVMGLLWLAGTMVAFTDRRVGNRRAGFAESESDPEPRRKVTSAGR